MADSPTFYEFFAGGGMVRAGLGSGWRCLFANDIDAAKADAYRANWGDRELRLADIHTLTASDLPGVADLMWGSFPCQDLSLAGRGAGLDGARSGSFHAFFRLVDELRTDGRAPRIVTVENVCGTLTSRGGQDFEAVCRAFVVAGYRPAPFVINADLFVPQSRPRLFVVGIEARAAVNLMQARGGPFHSDALMRAVDRLPPDIGKQMLWLELGPPDGSPPALSDVLEVAPAQAVWHPLERTQRLLAMMSPVQRAKVERAREEPHRTGAVFLRTRTEAGRRVQRAEVRFDRAGCLRTPAGGSSRQIVLDVRGMATRSRLMTGRETARLMGLGDGYRLPDRLSAALHLTGDGVAAPVVAFLANTVFATVLQSSENEHF